MLLRKERGAQDGEQEGPEAHGVQGRGVGGAQAARGGVGVLVRFKAHDGHTLAVEALYQIGGELRRRQPCRSIEQMRAGRK